MLPVERPLLSKQLELLDDVLAQGIAPHKVSPPSSSFTSIRGRVGRSEAAAPSSRDAAARGVAMASPRTHLCWKRRRRDATHKSRWYSEIRISPVDVPAGLARGRPARRDALEEEEEEVQEETFELEEQQHRPVRPAVSCRAFACLREKRPRRWRRAGTSRRWRMGTRD